MGAIITGFGNYLYQVLMGRMLSLQDFGTLAALVNFFAFASVPVGALTTITIQKVAVLKAHNQFGELRYVLFRLMKVFAMVGIGLAVLFLLFTIPVTKFLRLDSVRPYVILSIATSFIALTALLRGALPGLQRFKELSWNTILDSVVKLGLAMLFVTLSFGIAGAVGAVAIASALACGVLVVKFIKEFRNITPQAISLADLPHLGIIVVSWTLALTTLQNIDMIFVKRFFSADEAGLYAAMSILGKIIFFASTSVAGVLLPMAIELYEAGNHQAHRKLMVRALLLLLCIGLIGLFFYWFMPSFIVSILFGVRYLPFVQYLPKFALVAVGLSIVQLFASYFLAIRRKWFLVVLIGAPVVEGVVLFFFHASVDQVINTLILVVSSLACLLALFFIFDPLVRKL